mgnify:CR=1 FL=1
MNRLEEIRNSILDRSNDNMVEGVVTIAGREWSDGKNYRKAKFKQD